MIEARTTRSAFPMHHSSKRSSSRWFVLAVSTALCWILAVSGRIVSVEGAAAAASRSSSDAEPPDLGVIDLTSKSFGSQVGVGDGTVWLIEFYTPGCLHCINFAAQYSKVAHDLHSMPDEKIRVARVDCSVERALMTRFGIHAFPSFFLLSGWEVYEFNEKRSPQTLSEFALGGYKKKNPIPFMNSPMGPMGLLQGTLIFVGTRAMGVLDDLHAKFGISPFISSVIISIVGMFCGMISIIVLTVLSTPSKAKND